MISDHLSRVVKRGCHIVTSDPETGTIEGKIQRGEIMPINAFYFTPLWRWPRVGETWIIREEQGSWFLDSIFEEQEGTRVNEGQVTIDLDLRFFVTLNPTKI